MGHAERDLALSDRPVEVDFTSRFYQLCRPESGASHFMKLGPYRFFFFSNEGFEPPHIHVQRDRELAKFWLSPVRLARSTRFTAHELAAIEGLVRDNEEQLLETWHEFFGR